LTTSFYVGRNVRPPVGMKAMMVILGIQSA